MSEDQKPNTEEEIKELDEIQKEKQEEGTSNENAVPPVNQPHPDPVPPAPAKEEEDEDKKD